MQCHQRGLHLAPGAVIVCAVAAAVNYIYAAYRGEIKTVLVTWLVMTAATALNLLVILLKHKRINTDEHAAILVAVVCQTAVLLSVWYMGAHVSFTPFHHLTLFGSLAGFLIFLWERTYALISAIAINAAVTVGFIPLWVHLWDGGVSESLTTWILIATAGALGIVKPIYRRNHLALVYPARSFCTSISVILLTGWNTTI